MTSFEANPFTWKLPFNFPMHFSIPLAWAHGESPISIETGHLLDVEIKCGLLKMITVLVNPSSVSQLFACAVAAAASRILRNKSISEG